MRVPRHTRFADVSPRRGLLTAVAPPSEVRNGCSSTMPSPESGVTGRQKTGGAGQGTSVLREAHISTQQPCPIAALQERCRSRPGSRRALRRPWQLPTATAPPAKPARAYDALTPATTAEDDPAPG
jgi:hypothetical protein